MSIPTRILAAEFLKTITRQGLGAKLFHTMRFEADGRERADFILNKDPWRSAGILIALDNFGCGSSREHAPWALKDFGISCIIAPSFADIFYNNCFKNGILPVVLNAREVARLMTLAGARPTAIMTVDLRQQRVSSADGQCVSFDIESERREALIQGLDEIASSLKRLPEIQQWEFETRVIAPGIDPRFLAAQIPGARPIAFVPSPSDR